MSDKQKKLFVCFILIHFALLLLMLGGKLNIFFNDASLRKGQAADFFAVYQAGDNIKAGKSLYLDTEGISTPYSYPFRYLPFVGYTLGVILSILSPFVSYYLWIFICEGLLLINIYLTYRLINKEGNFLVASIPWLLFSPYLLELHMGQFSFFVASIMFWSIYGLLRKSKLKYLYLFSPLIKPNALIIIPILIRLREFKIVLTTMSSVLITSFLYFIFFPKDIAVFLRNFKDVLYSHGGNLGFKSLYYLIGVKYLQIPYPRIWFFGFVVLLGILTLYFTFKFRNIVLSFALWICYFFLIYKDVWEHHFVLLMPVFSVIITRYSITLKKLLNRKNLALLIAFILIALPTPFVLQSIFIGNSPVEPDNLSFIFVIPYHLIKVLGVILLYIWSTVRLTKKKKDD